MSEKAINAVRQLTEDTIHAFNQKDLAKYLSAMTDDLQAFAGVGSPFLFDGKDAWKGFIAGLASAEAVTYVQHNPVYRVFNKDTVICNGYYDFTVADSDGAATTSHGRSSMVFVRVGGDWRVANMHFSNSAG